MRADHARNRYRLARSRKRFRVTTR